MPVGGRAVRHARNRLVGCAVAGYRGEVGASASSYETFLALHHGPAAFVMPNAWDATSALLLKRAGFQALGTSSLAIAFAAGRRDGAHAVDRTEAIRNAVLLAKVSGLPVNGDLEDGFGPGPEDCAATVDAAVDAGLAGLGIEDTTADPAAPIHDFDHAVERVRAAAERSRGRVVLTGRTDNFLHGRADLDDTVRRLVAFAEVGVDVVYAPGLPDMAAIRRVVAAVAPVPVNVLIGPRTGPVPLSELGDLGVRRVSLGGALYRQAMTAVVEAATRLAHGDLAATSAGVPIGEIEALLP
jgi:2-methylisocitrate lyase-like PEP mutase family enzyme